MSKDKLGFEVFSPRIFTVGDILVSSSFRGLVKTAIWLAYDKAPTPLQAALNGLRSRLRKAQGFAHVLGRYKSAAEIAYVRRLVSREQPDLILYDGLFNYCGRLAYEAAEWLISHDVKSERAKSFSESGHGILPRDFSAEIEAGILRDIGNAIAIQWDEAESLKTLAPECNVVVVPVSFKAIGRRGATARIENRCVFVGSGSYHNVDGLRWLLSNCWETIRRNTPAATLYIYGTVCFAINEIPAGVTLCGAVESLSEAYASAAAVLIPLRVGSGLKVKLIEALVHGSAIVTTSVGAQGLGQLSPAPFIVADEPSAFCAEVTKLLRSPELQTEFSEKAEQFAVVFDPDRAFDAFARAIGKQ
jgi:hypothetical protein